MNQNNGSSVPGFAFAEQSTEIAQTENVRLVQSEAGTDLDLIPDRSPTYEPDANYGYVKSIIERKLFYPVFIAGLSGCGKTIMVEQACAELGRECMRVNITEETTEEDLIGGNTMVNGNIVYQEGPVLTAMRRGAILLLDEIDLNATKILCLQPILEGHAFFNKRTNVTVHPKPGFNVFATANTKGRGSDKGMFFGTKMLNEAFLERFPITLEHDFPNAETEAKILRKNYEILGVPYTAEILHFVQNLCRWAADIRKTFNEDGIDNVISTRRLVSIVRAHHVFGEENLAMALCLSRFDYETKDNFLKLWSKINIPASMESKMVEDEMFIPEIASEWS